MALVACRECKKEVANNAKTCPHCGTQNPALTQAVITLSKYIVAIIVIIIVGGALIYREIRLNLAYGLSWSGSVRY